MKNKTTATLTPHEPDTDVSVLGLRTLYENYQGGLIVTDRQCRLVYVNQEALSALGAHKIADDVHLLHILAPIADVRDLLDASFHGKISSVTTTLPAAHGHAKLELAFFPLVAAEGRVCSVGISIKKQDIASCTMATGPEKDGFGQPGFQTMAQFESFMDNCPLTAWATDERGVMIYINKPFQHFTGLSDEIVGKSLFEIFPPDMAKAYYENNVQVLEAGQSIEAIERVQGPDGTQLITKVHKFPFTIGDSRIIGGWSVDITSYIDLQEKLVEQEKLNGRELLRQVIEAQENERENLSKELHDNVNQILSSCKLMLEAACDFPEKSPVLTRKCYENIQTVINEIRKISHNLSPYTIDNTTLVESIRLLAEEINLSGRIAVKFDYRLDTDNWLLGTGDKIAVYRIVQELLNNVLKHAKASHVQISLSKHENTVIVQVTDDGVGFGESEFRQGIGFRNIRNRMHNYRGKLEVLPNRPKGCQVRVSLLMV